jgi:hypothetical protein
MDFWNDNTMFVTQKKWKMWIQKRCQSSVKIKNKTLSNEELVKFIEISIYIYIYIILKTFKWHDCYIFFLENPIHIKNLIFCMNSFINHMLRDIFRLAYQYLQVKT